MKVYVFLIKEKIDVWNFENMYRYDKNNVYIFKFILLDWKENYL